MPEDFEGKVALVTGGSRGIGRAITLEFARRGADVVINYFRNPGPAQETAQRAKALGVRTLLSKANVGEPARVQGMFQEIRDTFGGLDILVNNAASGIQRSAMNLETKHWDWTQEINVRGPWLCSKEAASLMVGRQGKIVNISSLGSHRVMETYTSVGVSKAALEALTRYLAVELASRGILVNCVSGGVVMTEALNHFPNKDEMIAASEQSTPAGRMVTPEDIAKTVAFLCTEDAEMIVGQTIIVDGGMSIPWTNIST